MNRSLAAIGAGGQAGLTNRNLNQLGENFFEPYPQPAGDMLGGGELQFSDIIQMGVVKSLNERAGGSTDISVIHQKAGGRGDLTFDDQLQSVTMSVKGKTGVTGTEMIQPVRGLK